MTDRQSTTLVGYATFMPSHSVPDNYINTSERPRMRNTRIAPLKFSIFTDPKAPVWSGDGAPITKFLAYMDHLFTDRHLAVHTLSLSSTDADVLNSIGDRYSGRISVHPVGMQSDTFPLVSSLGKLHISDPRPLVHSVDDAMRNAIDATTLTVLFPERPLHMSADLRSDPQRHPLTTRALLYAETKRRATLVLNPNGTPPLLLFTNDLKRSTRPPSSLFYTASRSSYEE